MSIWSAGTIWLAVAVLAGAPLAFSQAPPPYILRTVAGSHLIGDGGLATVANLENPTATVGDKVGNIYILDAGHARIRRVSPDGVISTFAPLPFASGNGMTLDGDGNLLVATVTRIVRITPDGTTATIAGKGSLASDGDGQPALSANMAPFGIAWAPDGSIYFTESAPYNTVRKIDPSGRVTTIAGQARTTGFQDNVPAGEGKLNAPRGLTLDAEGNVYVADLLNYRIRKISAADGRITTVAGNGGVGVAANLAVATASSIGSVQSIAIDSKKVLHYATLLPSRLATIASDGVIRVGGSSFTNAQLHVDSTNGLLIAEPSFNRVLRLAPDASITNFAGTSRSTGDGGPANAAALNKPAGIAIGLDGSIYIADTASHRIRKVDPNGAISTVAGTGVPGFSGDGSAAKAALLSSPEHLAIDQGGNLFINDKGNTRIRKVTPAGIITTVAGRTFFAATIREGTPATDSYIGLPDGLTVDRTGRIYLSHFTTAQVWMVDSAGLIRLIAGKGQKGFGGDGGRAVDALLDFPRDLFFDEQGNLFIADYSNSRIRKVTPAGTITTWLGNGTFSATPLGAVVGPSTPFPNPGAMAQDPAGNIFLVRGSNAYQITPNGQIFLIAGGGVTSINSSAPFPEDISARSVSLSADTSLALDRAGKPLIVNENLNRVLRLEPNAPGRLEAVNGITRTGAVGRALTEPLRIRVVGQQEVPVNQASVTFAVISGEATPATRTVLTDAAGIAQAALTIGAVAGEIVVRATTPGVEAAVDFTITTLGPGIDGNLPEIVAVPNLSINAHAAITGRFFAVEGTDQAPQPESGNLPVALAGVCVEFDGRQAPILRVRPQEITVIVPVLESAQTAVKVTTGCGTANPAHSAIYNAAIRPATPDWQYVTAGEDGRRSIRMTNEAGEVLASAKPGESVRLWGTGFGITDPPAVPGARTQDLAKVVGPVEIKIGDRVVSAADIFYLGLAPGNPGVYVIVLRIAADLEEGDHALTLRTGDAVTPPGVFIPVRK